MNQKFYYFLFLFFFFLIKISAQQIDSLSLFKDIKGIFQKETIKKDFYVFLVNTSVGANTNGHTLLVSYKSIRAKSQKQPIFYILNESENVNALQLNDYFEKILKIPNDDKNVHKIIHKNIYEKYHQKNLTEIIYVYNQRIFFQQTLKFFDLTNITNFPINIFELKEPTKIVLDTAFLHIGMSKYFPIGNKILQMSEVDNRVCLINAQTGKIEKVLAHDKNLKALDLFQKYITKDKKAIKIAQENHKFFENSNRLDKVFYNAFLGSDNHIYISFSISIIIEQTKKEEKVDAGSGDKTDIKKGELFGNIYLFLLKCNHNLDIVEIYHTDQEEKKDMLWISPSLDDNMLCDGKTIYTFNIPQQYLQDSVINPKYNYAVSKLELGKNKAFFKEKIKPKMFENLYQAQNMTNHSTFFEWQNQKYVTIDFTPFMYELGKEEPIYKLKGIKNIPEKPNYFPITMEDMNKIFINYRIRKQGMIDENYMFTLYNYQDTPILEIIDKSFKLVQQILINNNDFTLFFLNNAFYQTSNENGRYYLVRYALEKN